MRRWAWLPLLLVAAASRPSGDPETLLRRADAAFEAGRHGRAAELYELAGVRTTEPARAAFNLATARYRQASDTPASLGEAEVHYRACLDSDEYRARALFGLGNCLMLRATAAATLDRAALRAAIDRYAGCRADRGCGAALAADARYNQARARLLLSQASPPTTNEEPPGGDQPKDDDEPPKTSRNGGDPDRGIDLRPAPGGPGEEGKAAPEPKDGTSSPGRGMALPPVSDDGEPLPLAKEDAERHLDLAVRRIFDEAAAYRRGKARPAGAKDW